MDDVGIGVSSVIENIKYFSNIYGVVESWTINLVSEKKTPLKTGNQQGGKSVKIIRCDKIWLDVQEAISKAVSESGICNEKN